MMLSGFVRIHPTIILSLLAIVAALLGTTAFAFSPTFSLKNNAHSTNLFAVNGEAIAAKTTLSDETTWDFRFSLKGLPTKKGKRVDEIFVTKVHFIEEEGYEPPQGYVQQIKKMPPKKEESVESENASEEGEAIRFKITKSRWQLSEDPNERKDGLWVWGLFQEPLYPFLLLQLETDSIPLAGEDGDSILPLKLFAQLKHKREKEVGVILSSSNDLKVRVIETMKADPFGAATVDVYEEVSVGNLQVQPM